MQLTTIDNTVTMTSLELVQFINSQRDIGSPELAHSDFLKKVPLVLGEIGAGNLSSTYRDVQNKERPCYKFPKREACLMAMSYSYDLQAKVFDRMTELEDKQKPDIMAALGDPRVLQGLLSDYASKVIQLQDAVEAQRPAVEFVERYVEAKSSKAISDVAKILGAKPHAFFGWLHECGIIFKRDGSWMPYSGVEHYFEVKTGESNGHAFTQSKFTPHGIAWISEKWNKSSAL